MKSKKSIIVWAPATGSKNPAQAFALERCGALLFFIELVVIRNSMRNFKLFILCSFIISSTQIFSQSNLDELEPVESIFNIYDYQFEYYSNVRKILFNGLDDNPEIRYLVMPSFSPENVLLIEHNRDENKYYLIHNICETMIWSNPKWEKVKVKHYQKEISSDYVSLLMELFKAAIKKQKFPEDLIFGCDGEDYYFSVRDYGQKTGKTWSPSSQSKMGRLVAIGNKLIDYSKKREDQISFPVDFLDEIKALTKEFE
jgi:hypothetical protein